MATLIGGGYVVTMNASRDVHDGGFVLLGDDGRIAAVGPGDQQPRGFHGERIDAAGMIVLPGLVNAGHRPWQHLAMGLAAGTDEALLPIIEGRLGAEDLGLAARLAAFELASGGVTTVLHHLPRRADAARLSAAASPFAAAGMRQLLGIDFAANGASAAEAALGFCNADASGRTLLALTIASDPVSLASGRIAERTLEDAYGFARRHGLRIVTAPGGKTEPAQWSAALRRSGRSAPMHLMELGLLDDHWLLEGVERLGSTDLALLKESGCSVAATPLAEAVLGRASTHWAELARSGVPCAIATGGPAFSCTVDMVEEMKAMLLLQNTLRLDPASMSAEAVLEMATLGGARALGLAHEIGSLEAGKRGDVAVFDLRQPHLQVSHKPISTFVCCARGRDAHAVFVDGRAVHRAGGSVLVEDDLAVEALGRRALLLGDARAHGGHVASTSAPGAVEATA